MKTLLQLLTLLSIAGLAHAESDGIKVAIKLVQADSLLSSPSVTVQPGKEAKIIVTRDFVNSDGRILPVGLILDVVADFKDGKIKYSCLFTFREHQKTKALAGNNVSSFKTQEFMMAGLAESGKENKADLGDKTTISIALTRVAPDGSEKKVEPVAPANSHPR